MATADFYDTPERQSIVKTKIVSQYFAAWSRIMLRKSPSPIAYVDLFSGPGVFADGTPSTPLWILNYAIKNGELCTRLVSIFNDKDPAYADQLREAIEKLPGLENVLHKPEVSNFEVSGEIVQLLGNIRMIPTLFFIDPWGYKGLSLDLIGATIRNWGCECIFFFNYNRVYSGLRNHLVTKPMDDLFGVHHANELRRRWDDLSLDDRQKMVIGEFAEAVREIGGRYVLPFGMKSQHGDRTSHYIIFVSKHPLGYKIMKEVMAKLSSDENEVKTFEYVPVRSPQLRLLDPENPYSIAALKALLLELCAGRSLTVDAVYEQYTIDTVYLLRHVKRALIELESEGRVIIETPRPRGTLAGHRTVTFPS